jgi:hypothetical protein
MPPFDFNAMQVLSGFAIALKTQQLSQPHFEGSVRSPLTLPKMGVGLLRDSQKLRRRLQGSKHLALRYSLYRWKGLEM